MWCRTVGVLVMLTLSLLAAPLMAGAQPAGRFPTIGFMTHNTAAQNTQAFEAFAQGLRELGYIEGQTITIERRIRRQGEFDRVPVLVADLAARPIDVFVVTTNLIAKAVQQTMPQSPIVMLVAEEPVTPDSSRASRILGAPSRGWRWCPARPSMAKIWSF